jgi:cell division protein FtsB
MKKRLLSSKSFIFFLLVVLVLIAVALGRESYRYFKVNQDIKNLEEKIEELKKSNEELIGLEEYFQSEDFLEKQARLKLNLTKPGEKVIIIKQIEQDLGLTEETIGIAKELSNVQKWWKYFFGEKDL